jgi:hypothetical protein
MFIRKTQSSPTAGVTVTLAALSGSRRKKKSQADRSVSTLHDERGVGTILQKGSYSGPLTHTRSVG